MAAAASHQPDAICIVGDWLDLEELPGDRCFSATQCAKALAELTCPLVFSPGNHDDTGLWEFCEALKKFGKAFTFLPGSAAKVGPLVIIGSPPRRNLCTRPKNGYLA